MTLNCAAAPNRDLRLFTARSRSYWSFTARFTSPMQINMSKRYFLIASRKQGSRQVQVGYIDSVDNESAVYSRWEGNWFHFPVLRLEFALRRRWTALRSNFDGIHRRLKRNTHFQSTPALEHLKFQLFEIKFQTSLLHLQRRLNLDLWVFRLVRDSKHFENMVFCSTVILMNEALSQTIASDDVLIRVSPFVCLPNSCACTTRLISHLGWASRAH